MDRTDTIRFAVKECSYDDGKVVFYTRYGGEHDCLVLRTVQSKDGRESSKAVARHQRWENRKTASYEEIADDALADELSVLNGTGR